MKMTLTQLNDPMSTIRLAEISKKVVVFTCTWNALSGLEAAGRANLSFSPNIYPIKVKCIGQLSSGVILKTLEHGAYGVLILGCSPGDCHYRFGYQQAESVFSEVKSLSLLLGYQDEQLKLNWISKGDGAAFFDEIQTFISNLNRNETDNG